MKILVFGSCNIDYVYKMRNFVKPEETAASLGRECFPGGKGLNQSIAIARAGAQVYHAGCIGEDGIFLKDLLDKSGVNTDFLKVTDAATGHAIIQVDREGENCIILYPGANHLLERSYIDTVIEKFDTCDVLVLQNEINEIEYIVEKAYSHGMKIVFNPSPFYDNIKKLDLNKISYLILNELEASEFSGSQEPYKIIEFFRTAYPRLKIILTLGVRGCVYFDDETEVQCPSFAVPVVDTTSAGDTFMGYFISALIYSSDVKKALRTASVAAALAVSRKGAASSIPHLKEVEDAICRLTANRNINIKEEQEKALVASYLKEHLKDATLSGAASALGYSRTYAASWIKKNMGKSFSELLMDERCNMAAHLLRTSDISIKDIINLCGYENGAFFRKIFYLRYEKTLFEYRKAGRT